MNQWNRMPEALKEQVFQRLDRLAAVANLSEADRIAYDKAVDSFSVSQIVMEDQFKKGERKKQLEIALNLKKAEIPLEQIALATGLSLEEVKDL